MVKTDTRVVPGVKAIGSAIRIGDVQTRVDPETGKLAIYGRALTTGL